MKTTVVCAAMLCGVAATSSAALGQQYAPPAARPAMRYAPPTARLAQRSPASYAGARVQQPMAHSMAPATVASAPMPSFRPINPPPQSMQRALVASRTPTPAPPQARTASSTRTTAQPLPAYQPTQGWVSPSSTMPYNGGAAGTYNGANGTYNGGATGTYNGAAESYDGGASGYATNGDPGAYESSGYDPSTDYSFGGGCGADCGRCGFGHRFGNRCGNGCGHGFGHCCGQCLHHGILIPHCSTGDMVQHTPFFGTTHGYYYFRPYHVMHVYSQQELATRWGGDPRNPYDNTMFQRIYEQMGIEARPVTTVPTVVPSAAPEYTVPGATYMPTPVPYGAMPSIPMSPGATTTPSNTFTPSNTLPMPGIEPIPSPAR